MKTLTGRVEHLEQATGVSGSPWCECEGGKVTVLWDTGERVQPFCGPWPEVAPEPEPATCPRCGRPVPDVCPKCGKPTRIIRVVWEDEAYWKGRPGIELA